MMKNVRICASNNPENCIPKAYISGANYNITIRQKACWSQLELGFNWTASISLLHLEVEWNVAAKILLRGGKVVSKIQQLVNSSGGFHSESDRYPVLLMASVSFHSVFWYLVACCLYKQIPASA